MKALLQDGRQAHMPTPPEKRLLINIDLRSFDTQGPGDIVDGEGKVLGQHRGIHHYTIGQRKGLGVAVGHPVYVVEIDAAANRIVLGERDQSLRSSFTARDVLWTGERSGALLCQVRYNHRAAPCTISAGEGETLSVTFDEPQFAHNLFLGRAQHMLIDPTIERQALTILLPDGDDIHIGRRLHGMHTIHAGIKK